MYTLLRRKLGGLRSDAIEFARELVRIRSLTLEEGLAAEKVCGELEELGYDKVVSDEFGNVVGVIFGRETKPNVLLVSHMDTVAPAAERWETDPYGAEIREGRLYGLGASDCKGGLAAQAYAGALLSRSLLPLRGNLIFAATVAEGNGRSVGVRGLIEKTLPDLGLAPDYAILGEPTNLGLYYGHDGWVELKLVVEGANPFHVDDAARAIAEDFSADRAESEERLAVTGPQFEDLPGSRRATLLMNRRLNASTPVGEVVDQVRREAVRAAAPDTAVVVKVQEKQERLYTGHYEIVRNLANAWAIDPYDLLVERSRQALAAGGIEVRPRRWKLGRLGMGTAGGTLVNDYHISTVGYGPGSEEVAHACDEYVEVEKIVEAIYGTAVIAHGLVGIPVFGWTSDEI